ncbi:hypothetical protein J2T02_002562 [Chitinophaga terrae (ex Kim and Jung 2007)]|uniref:hypothetical protein n=1 Tax=Chitinophaga terrae (ex Kim and Jung 2007) TaxID=408074 RepID=UPI00278AEF5A|nr:hypothetical protein [Chitinophaga terrae (ex Kim and Jung 2007)]MDQ0107443.1 hypothetical protein [Chitinophaga terrae (ex Kim and Jung 2007)]
MDVTSKKENIFWHEVGHYCAEQINKTCFQKFGCQGIVIHRVNQDGMIKYQGSATPIKPPNFDPNETHIIHPASLVGSLVYGCIFQSCFLNQPFEYCFDVEHNGANGFHDYYDYRGVVSMFFLSPDEKSQLEQLVFEQLAVVKADISECGIFKIDIAHLIGQDTDRTDISSEELDGLFSEFLHQHASAYKTFVEKIEKLFEGKKQYKIPGKR